MSEPPSQPSTSARLLGAHMPTAGGLKNSLISGHKIGCTAVQLFTGSPRQWHHPPLDPQAAADFLAMKEETGITFTVAHDSYLINLAAPDGEILEKSRKAFRRELERAEALDIPWVVTHMGAYLDSGEDTALDVLCESLTGILRETEGMRAGVALETTAGQGTCLGHKFEQIARVLDGCAHHPRMGVCLDTCHIFVAGYDIRDQEAYDKTFNAFGSTIGFDKLKVIHANDAKKPLGSRVDRHEHIGEGEIGIEAFGRLVTDSRMLHVPVVIETPELETMHHVNLARLKRLAAGGSLGMRVTVRLFGHYRDYCGDGVELEMPAGATVTDVAVVLATKDARMQGVTSHCRAAVNEEYTTADTLLNEGDEVAFIPPMSGG
jgi:deoxyribonuclease IV